MFFQLIEAIAKMGQLCYEPIWIAGGIGLVLLWGMRSCPRSAIYWSFAGWVMMLLWRSQLSAISSRYVVIVLFGVILLASYGVYAVPEFLARYRSVSPKAKSVIRGGLLLLLIGSCLAKFFHMNPYAEYLVSAHQAIALDAKQFGGDVVVLNFDSEADDNRHRYYSRFPVFSGGVMDADSFMSENLVNGLIADSGKDAVYVLVRHRAKQPFATKNEPGGLSEVYSCYTSRNKRYKLSVWRFLPASRRDLVNGSEGGRIIREWNFLPSAEVGAKTTGNGWEINKNDTLQSDPEASLLAKNDGLAIVANARFSLYCVEPFSIQPDMQIFCRLTGRQGSRVELAAYYYDKADRYIGVVSRALELPHSGLSSIILPIPGADAYSEGRMRLVFRLISGEVCLKQMVLFQK